MKRESVRSNQRKLGVLPHRGAGDEVELLPEAVELPLPVVVEHQLVERAVVAEVARHAVEPGAEQPPGVAPSPSSGRGRRGPAPRRRRRRGRSRRSGRTSPRTAGRRPGLSGTASARGRRARRVQLAGPDLRRRRRRSASGWRRTGGSSRARSGCEPLLIPGAVRFLTSGTSWRRSSTTKSRIRSQPARAASGRPPSGGGSSRHSAWSAAIGPTSSGLLRRAWPRSVARYFAAEPRLGGEVGQRRLGLAQGRAVPVPPGREEVVGVVGRLPLVEVDDPA